MSDTHEYRVFVSICTRFEREYSRIFAVKNEYENEYGFAPSREYSYSQIYIHYTPCPPVNICHSHLLQSTIYKYYL